MEERIREGKRKRKEKQVFLSTLFQFYSVLKTELRTGKYESPHYFLVIQFSLYFPSEPNRRTLFFFLFYPFSLQFLRSKWSHNNITLIKKLRWRDKVAYSSIPLWPTQNGLTRVWQKWTVHANFSQSISVGACLGIILVAKSWYQKNIFCKSEKLTSSCHLQYKP